MTKFLNISTDTNLGGSSASDEVVSSQKAIKTYVDNHSGGGSVAIDEKSITKNSSDEIQTVGVIDQRNTANAIKTWTGTKAQYDAISTKDANTIYNITDDTTALAYEAYTKSETNALLAEKVNLASGVSQADVDYVVESQFPTASNNYTWYRLYKSGWVEQGGRTQNNSGTSMQINFSVEMANTDYWFTSVADISNATGDYNLDVFAGARSVSSMTVYTKNGSGSAQQQPFFWEVKGMSA